MQRQYANYGRRVIARCEGEDDGNPDNPAKRIKRILALMARVSTLKPMESPFTTDPETAQTAADSKHDRTVRSRIALARKMNRGEKTMKTQERTETIRGFVGGYPTIGRKVYEDGESTSYAAENIEFGEGVITIIRGLASIFRDCFGGLHRFVEVTI